MPERAVIEGAVARYFEAVRAFEGDAFVACFATDAVSHDPVGAPPFEGHAGLRKFFDGMAQALERASLTEDRVFVAGDQAAVKWSGHAVGKNGRQADFEGIDVLTVDDDGKIRELRAYWDPAAMMAQLQD